MRNSGKAYPPPERSERSLRIRADLQRSHVRLKQEGGTSLGAQWSRICLRVRGTRVQCPVWEDSAWCRAAKSTSHSFWRPRFLARQGKSPQWGAWAPQPESSPCSPPLGKAHVYWWRPSQCSQEENENPRVQGSWQVESGERRCLACRILDRIKELEKIQSQSKENEKCN